MSDDRTARIRALNDAFRTTREGGRVVATKGVAALPAETFSTLMDKVRTFTAFTTANDPLGEHDFGVVEHEGERFFFKIDYYDKAMEGGSDDPTDPARTARVLTVMKAYEY